MGRLLCKLGWHEWRLYNGRGFSVSGGGPMLIHYERECRRCGKHECRGMIA
jgi:hypothetical protein